jgi:ABC-type sugar transport system ATPase subunit
MSTPILQLESIAKSFAGTKALRDVSFQLFAGEVHALVGENGAGKSTLTRVITGEIRPDAGTLSILGHPIREHSIKLARSLGIAAVYQQPSLFPHLSVAENIALTLEQSAPARVVNWKRRRARAVELMRRVGGTIDPRRVAASLSMAEQQIVEIARAIGTDTRILLMDEPTALLTEEEVRHLFSLIARMRANGVGIVYISHRLEEIQEIADRITVLRDGESIGTSTASEVNRTELIEMMVGRTVSSIFPKREVRLGETALQLHSLENRAVGLSNISLTVRSGEILGLAGLVGSGRSELATTLFGLTPCESPVLVQGQTCRITSPQEAIRLGIGFLPEDRRRHGVLTEWSIAQNISFANLGAVSKFGLVSRDLEDQLASKFVRELAVKTPSLAVAAGKLSGGNQQKVALARWLATRPRILILDEPTQGVDIGSKAGIHELIMALAERGLAILLISSELAEILGMSDRIAVMREGTIAGVLDRKDASQSRIMSMALGHRDDSAVAESSKC